MRDDTDTKKKSCKVRRLTFRRHLLFTPTYHESLSVVYKRGERDTPPIVYGSLFIDVSF